MPWLYFYCVNRSARMSVRRVTGGGGDGGRGVTSRAAAHLSHCSSSLHTTLHSAPLTSK
ncbi:hypothetical protein JYU34_007200 [Plutella xylostella]|uniref:Uncharacterized protein n=1 Tax=Plutella xylostella TaxID=51655 RepID=A0ABQ7QPU7_PLUXY|nr:hypothetical protein JYU34_007200 [Plutella xylostella]